MYKIPVTVSGLYVWDKNNNINPIFDVAMTCKLDLGPVNLLYPTSLLVLPVHASHLRRPT